VRRFVANSFHLLEQTKKLFQGLDFQGAESHLSEERSQILDSAGGIRKMIPYLNGAERFFLLNGDLISPFPFQDLEAKHLKLKEEQGVEITLAIQDSDDPSAAYPEVLIDSRSSLIKGFGDKKFKGLFYTGIAAMESIAFSHLTEDVPYGLRSDIFLPLIEKRKLGFFRYKAPWVDIGSPLLWMEAHFEMMRLFQKQTLPKVWVNRLKDLNELVSEGICFSKKSISSDVSFNSLKGPFYWGGPATLPKNVPQNIVFYGDGTRSLDLAKGSWIHFHEMIVHSG
jgi:NDP-sugar pyrophosphorylase family protein